MTEPRQAPAIFHRAMSARTFLILTLVASLLFGPQARSAAPMPVEKKMPGCAMMNCVTGCCAQMACCVRSAQDQHRPEQAPAPQRVNLELAVLSLRTFSLLYLFPTTERSFVIRDEPHAAHALPTLAMTCIRLI